MDRVVGEGSRYKKIEEFKFILKDKFNVETKVVSENIYYKHPESNSFTKGDNLGAKYMLWYLSETFN